MPIYRPTPPTPPPPTFTRTIILNLLTKYLLDEQVLYPGGRWVVTVNNNSPVQDHVHPDDHTHPTYEMTTGFKPFTKRILINTVIACFEALFCSICKPPRI